ncbi:MAG: serine hydrolase domain-containing protein [Pseudoxanthomonas sp.]
MGFLKVLFSCGLLACVAFIETAVAQEPLRADTPSQTVAGNLFTAPKDWTVEMKGRMRILTPPEGGSHVVIIDVQAADADAAVAAAWAAYGPMRQWPLKLASDMPPQDGWEKRRAYNYETSANDRRLVQALALRKGAAWTVGLLDFDIAVLDKRGSQLDLVIGTLAPKGEAKESFAGKAVHKLDAARLQAIKDFVVQSQAQLEIPGVALGIVQDGKVLFSGGFGVRELGKPEPVDGDTLFMIASNTKALTTLMLARLVEQGRIAWDTPVTQAYPRFRLGDADTTRQVQVRHLVCACTGLPRQDSEWLFEGEKDTPETVMATLATMRPTSAFGDLFQYSNLMASAAGFVGGHVLAPGLELGAAYDKAMQEQVFDPLGMRGVTFDFTQAMAGNHATPHSRNVEGETVVAAMDVNRTIIAARPAGGAWSSANDLLKYVAMELAEGALPDGSRYIGPDPLLERRRKQVASGSGLEYGMGLETDLTWGVPVVHHGGSLIGFKSNMIWVPDAGVGVVVLTNSDAGGNMVYRLYRRLLEVLYDGRPEAAEAVAARARSGKESRDAERKRLTVPADPDAAAKLATGYRSRELGEIDVSQRDGATWFDFGGWKSEIASRVNDDGTLSFVTISPGVYGAVELIVADEGGARRLVIRDAQHEYVFDEAK